MNNVSLYLVSEGVVTPAEHDTPWDGVTSVLVVATCAEAALKIAAAYDNDEVQPDNIVYDGHIIAAIGLLDRHTGLFA